ncbi:MAG: MspA family porin [Gordonia sp. (in: high G+C Gram-positive bacteria)]
MSKLVRSGLRRLVGVGVVCVAAAMVLTNAGEAAAAATVRLPDGTTTSYAADGTKLVIVRTHEHVKVIPGITANNLNRSALFSGTYTAYLPKDKTGTLTVGYVYGCQLDMSDLGGSLGLSLDPLSLDGGASTTGTIPVAPGTTKKSNVNSTGVSTVHIVDGKGILELSDFRIDTSACGGYALARTFAVEKLAGNYYSIAVLWGKPFSLN